MAVDSTQRTYKNYSPQWARCRDTYAGSDAVKAKMTAYLPMLEGQVTALAVQSPTGQYSAYGGYLLRALFFPSVARTVAGLAGVVYGKPPTVKGVPKLYQQEFDDVTLDGDSLAAFGLKLTIEDLIVGRAGILIDFPEEAVAGARPYWVLYAAENIINWRAVRVAGKQMITLLVLREEAEVENVSDEFAPTTEVRYRVLRLAAAGYSVQVFRPDPNDKGKFVGDEVRFPQRRGASLNFIPFVPVSPTGLNLTPEHPPLLDLVDVNLSHYRTSADQEHGAHFTALPTPYVTGHKLAEGESLGIGSGTAWVFENENAKAGMVEFTGAGLEALKDLKEEKRQLMASLGARMLETMKKAAEAAETVKLKHAGERSALSVLADAVGQALTQALRWHLWWTGAEERAANEAVLTLNPDIMDQLTAQDMQALVAAWQAGAISHKTVYYNLQWGEWTRPEVEFEDEVAEIEGEVPEPPPIEPVVPPVRKVEKTPDGGYIITG